MKKKNIRSFPLLKLAVVWQVAQSYHKTLMQSMSFKRLKIFVYFCILQKVWIVKFGITKFDSQKNWIFQTLKSKDWIAFFKKATPLTNLQVEHSPFSTVSVTLKHLAGETKSRISISISMLSKHLQMPSLFGVNLPDWGARFSSKVLTKNLKVWTLNWFAFTLMNFMTIRLIHEKFSLWFSKTIFSISKFSKLYKTFTDFLATFSKTLTKF